MCAATAEMFFCPLKEEDDGGACRTRAPHVAAFGGGQEMAGRAPLLPSQIARWIEELSPRSLPQSTCRAALSMLLLQQSALPLAPRGSRRLTWHGVHVEDLTWQYSRSGGAGGQHVNKVDTKVRLLLTVHTGSTWMPPPVRQLFFDRHPLPSRPAAPPSHAASSNAGRACLLGVTSERYRTQEGNRGDCMQKMLAILAEAGRDAMPKEGDADQDRRVAALAAAHRSALRQEKRSLALKKDGRRRPCLSREDF